MRARYMSQQESGAAVFNQSRQLKNLNGIYDWRRPYYQTLAQIKQGGVGFDAPTISCGMTAWS